MNAFCGELSRAANIVDVIGISAVNHDIVFIELANQVVQRAVNYGCRNHQPYRARLLQFADKIID